MACRSRRVRVELATMSDVALSAMLSEMPTTLASNHTAPASPSFLHTAPASPSFLHTAPASPSFLFLLADDIGWADFGYNNGTAHTPRIDAWARAKGSVLLQDFHSGGTVCSPTRATVLTGRNHFRDCVDYVYDLSLIHI